MRRRDKFGHFMRFTMLSALAIALVNSGALPASSEASAVLSPAAGVSDTKAPVAAQIAGGGGEIRIVIVGTEIPLECISTGLVRYDTAGRLAPGLADTWVEFPASRSWRFTLRSELRDAAGATITETEIAAVLRSPGLRRLFDPPPRRVRVEKGAVVLQFPTRDRALPRRLAHPAAGIRVPGKSATGPYRLLEREAERAVLVRNLHAIVAARPDTVVIFLEPDASRAVFLVEAGYADAAPVGDEDLVRLSGRVASQGRLVAAAARDLHALSSSHLSAGALALIRRSVDRALITRTLLNGRGTPMGPGYRPLNETERRGLPRRIALRDESGSAANARLVARVAYDLRRSGLDCSAPSTTATSAASPGPPSDAIPLRYSVVSELDLPPTAVPLFAVTPYWFVRHRVADFAPPRRGVPGWLFARVSS